MLLNLYLKTMTAAYIACVQQLHTDTQPASIASLVNMNTLLITTTHYPNKQAQPQADQTANTHHLFTQNMPHNFDYFLLDANLTS